MILELSNVVALMSISPHTEYPPVPVSSAWLGIFGIVVWCAGCWISWRRKRLLLWLAWTLGGLCVTFALLVEQVPGAAIVMNIWYLSCFLLPCYWFYRSYMYGHRRPL